MSQELFEILLYCWIAIAILLYPIQLLIPAPYGRHANGKWGISMDNRLGWFLMEIVSPICFSWFFFTGKNLISSPMWIMFLLWVIHYFNRSIIYPLKTRTTGKRIPLVIVFSAAFFNIVNGWTNGAMLGNMLDPYPEDWLFSPQFIIGIAIFIVGMYINISADNTLIRLRKANSNDYSVPQGGLFNKISCPNHFGEILEWSGFAILCWNLAALAFAVWTVANLLPRAVSHHRWYKEHFKDYPTQRKAVIPFII